MILKRWSLQINEKQFCCEVPCTLFSVLRENGLIGDPYDRLNERQLVKYFECDCSFKTAFEADEDILSKRIILLEFDCLDTLCEIYLNGAKLGKADNFHRKWRFDVKEKLSAGKNIIELRFASAVKYARERMEKLYVWGNSEENGTLPGISYLRKPYYTFGWDWCPAVPDSGIVGEVRIDARDYEKIKGVTVRQLHTPTGVELRAEADFVGAGQIRTTLYDPGENKIFSGYGASVKLLIQNPELWWPNGYGEQKLYTLKTELFYGEIKADERIQRIGLRTVKLERKKDEYGESFAFVCNGVKIFAKGANIVPSDCMLTEDVSGRTEALIGECASANYNMLRVWGGGYYGSDFFYDLCDKYGILVWQDIMIACAHIYLDDGLERTLIAEAEENLERIGNHPSLALVCGNNEMEPCAADLAAKKNFPCADKIVSDYLRLYEEIFPELVRRHAPDTEYWPSSPSAGGSFYKCEDENYGDSHFWKVWGGLQPYQNYRKYYFRFLSEFGFVSFPPMESIEKFASPQDYNVYSEVMESHQKNPAGNAKCAYYLRELFEFPAGFDKFVFATQYIQADALETAITHLRANYGRCMGTLYWQLNDAYPAISFSVIDYYGKRKPAYYAVRRAYRSVMLTGVYEDGNLELRLVNETSERKIFRVKLWIADASFRKIYEEEFFVTKSPFEAGRVWMKEVKEMIAGRERELFFGYKLFERERETGRGSLLFVPPKLFRWREGNAVASRKGEREISVSSDVFLKFVKIEGEGELRLSDNCFDLIDGDPVKVIAEEEIPANVPLKIYSLKDIK